MKEGAYVWSLLVGFLSGCKAVLVEQPHIAAIQVVNDAGQGISGVQLLPCWNHMIVRLHCSG